MIDKDNERAKSFSRRAFVVGAIQGSLLCVLGGRLAWLQIVEGGRYKTLAENNRINIKMIAPSRGEIVDRYGVPLAINNQNFRVLVVPEHTNDLANALQKLETYVELQQRDIDKVLKQAKKSAKFIPLEVKDNLTWEEVAKVEVNLTDLPGVMIDVGDIRHYPFGHATAHLVGYVGAVSQADLTGDQVLTLPGFKIGKTGIEKAFEGNLRGAAGASEMEVNVVGREVRELKKQDSRAGKRITVTIDAELQRYTQERLQTEKSASAVIMDAQTGALYSLASHPSFDPHMFLHGISAERWEELLADVTFPLNNKAIAGQYPPGSTFKMITALAGLQEKIIHPRTTVFCPGHYEFGNDLFHCWKRAGHGHVDLVSALSESCDTYFYKVSTDIGIDKIADVAHQFGLGEKYGFELSEERPGLMPNKNWKMREIGERWQPGETIVASIGQGYIQATPLQLAVMTCRLVNGGFAVKPWITGYVGDQYVSEQNRPKMNFKKRHLDLVKKGMDQAVNDRQGTAFASQIEEPGMEMGGKTGTAQVKRITMQDRRQGIRNEDLDWQFRHHALFVGYAPMRNPRYVCSVVVEHGGGGSSTAAPIAKDLLWMAQKRDPASVPLRPFETSFDLSSPPPRKPVESGG